MVGRKRTDGAPFGGVELPELEGFDALLACARKHGCVRIKAGEIEVVFGPMPSKDEADTADQASARARKAKRDHYEVLLSRMVHDKELDMLPDDFR